MSKNVLLVFFSGTGGTARIADSFEADLIKRGYEVTKINLDRSVPKQENHEGEIPRDTDMLILIYPVYAIDAPPIVYDWISKVNADRLKTAVISVSGGGEAWPNTGCRNKCCEILEEHGLDVFYEKMMVMPANCITQTKDQLSMWLIKAIPEKVGKVLDNLLSGNVRRTHFSCGPIKKYIAKSAKLNYHRFAKDLEITDDCNGCGICSRNCPVSNITLTDKRPTFSNSCIMCLRCIYNCPQKAIKTNVRTVFKTGFSIERIEREMNGMELEPVEKLAKGIVWVGVKNYLLDIDGY